MLANQKLLVETMQASGQMLACSNKVTSGFGIIIICPEACHKNSDSILALVSKVCAKMSLADVASECEQVREVLKDTNTMFATLHDASTADLSQVLADVKKYASEVVVQDRECAHMQHVTRIAGVAASLALFLLVALVKGVPRDAVHSEPEVRRAGARCQRALQEAGGPRPLGARRRGEGGRPVKG